MNNIKILHTADLHLGSELVSIPEHSLERKRELTQTFRRIMETAAREAVDLVLIAGDLFEGSNVEPSITASVKEYLAAFPGRVFISPGNHDYAALDSPYLDGDWPDNVTIFQGALERIDLPDRNVSVYGAGFESTYQEASFLDFSKGIDHGRINLGVFHGEITAKGGSSRYHGISLADIAGSGLDYLALGHIHLRTEPARAGSTTFAYPGCPDGRGFDETGSKGVYIGQIAKGAAKLSFMPMSSRRYADLAIDISGAAGEANVRQMIMDHLRKGFGENFAANYYRITLTGQIPPDQALPWANIQAALAETLYYIRLIDGTRPLLDLAELALETSLRGIFARRMQEALAKASGEAERELLEKALDYGLRAFDGQGMTYEDQ